jgi:hypothetical protein
VAQTVAHGAQPADRPVELFCLGGEHFAVDPGPPAGREHERDFVQRKTGGGAEGDQRQLLQNLRTVKAAQAVPADRPDQALLLVEPQRRCGNAGALRNLRDVQIRLLLTSS